MSDEPRRPGGVFWTIILAAALIGYPLSWGLMLAVTGTGNLPESLAWTDHAYDPLRWILRASPECVGDTWSQYLIWSATHITKYLPAMPELDYEEAVP